MTLWVALVVLVAFSAFFSASETAFSSLNQIRLKSRADDGDRTAARVLAMAEKYDKLLSTILVGNNIVNIAAASIGTIIFTQMLGAERGATVSTIVLTIVVLIFGEVSPKSLAKEMPETVATAVAPVLSLLMVVFTPLTWLFSQWKRLHVPWLGGHVLQMSVPGERHEQIGADQQKSGSNYNRHIYFFKPF